MSINSDIRVLWDFDNDGDWSEAVEDISSYVLQAMSSQGRDWASLLQGKSTPGTLRLTLNNDDNRFSFFNSSSPLNAGNNSLESGRKVRIQTTETVDPGPARLAFDRFTGTTDLDGSSAESGQVWDVDLANANTFTKGFGRATQAGTAGVGTDPGLATIDLGQGKAFSQAIVSFRDSENAAGITVAYADNDNRIDVYFLGLGASAVANLVAVRTIAGVPLEILSYGAEDRDHVVIGALWDPTEDGPSTGRLHVYMDGVLRGSTAVPSGGMGTRAGIYSQWVNQRAPSLEEFYAWDDIQRETPGVLYTGLVRSVLPSVGRDHRKQVEVIVDGYLLAAARNDISEGFSSVGPTPNNAPGVETGFAIGNTLSRAGLLRPGGKIDRGTVTMGAVGAGPAKALTHIRKFEEVELGLVYETPEGPIAFDERYGREGSVSSHTFSDDPASLAGSGLPYEEIIVYDWNNEVINRVRSSLSPRQPKVSAIGGIAIAAPSGQNAFINLTMPAEGSFGGGHPAVGELIIAVIGTTIQTDGEFWLQPAGWTPLREALDELGKVRIYAKKLTAADFGAQSIFYADDGNDGGTWRIQALWIHDWFGSLSSGVQLSEPTGYGPPLEATARLGTNDPPAILPSWGLQPTLFIAGRVGMSAPVGSAVVQVPGGGDFTPNGYSNMNSAYTAGISGPVDDVGIQLALRDAVVGVENPSPFLGDFNNFDYVEAYTLAIRGYAGDPPETDSGQVVQSDNLDSQDSKNAILSYRNPADLFDTVVDATAYNDLILDTYSTDRPVIRISYTVNKSIALRNAAKNIRIGSLVTVESDTNSGLGISDDFIVARVGHRFSDGTKSWVVDYDLAPNVIRVVDTHTGSGAASLTFSATADTPNASTPLFASTTESTETGFVTTHTISLPATINVGDRLVLNFGADGSGGVITKPVGWDEILNGDLNANQLWRIYDRVADGTEGATITVSTTLGNKSASTVTRITDGSTLAGLGSGYNISLAQAPTTDTTPDPPSVTAGWGTEVGADNFALALMYAGADDPAVTVYPAGFNDGQDVSSGATVAVAWDTFASATIDPGAFTIDASKNNSAAVYVLRPGSTGAAVGIPAPTIPTFTPTVFINPGTDVATVVAASPNGTHIQLNAGDHGPTLKRVRCKQDMHIQFAVGAFAIHDGLGSNYGFVPDTQGSSGVVIGGAGATRQLIQGYGGGTTQQEFGALMAVETDILGEDGPAEFSYADTEGWFTYGLYFKENSSNGIAQGSNHTIYDCEFSGHTVTGIGVDRVVGGLWHTLFFHWNALNPATGSGSNGAQGKLSWVNGNVGRTSITPINRTPAQFRASNITMRALNQETVPLAGQTDIGFWADLDCEDLYIEYFTIDDHPAVSVFFEGCNGHEAAHITINRSDGTLPTYGFNFRGAALKSGESTNGFFHHITFNDCQVAVRNSISNRSDDWLNPLDFNQYALITGLRYWILNTETIPGVPGQSNMWTGNNTFEDLVFNNCDYVLIDEGEDNATQTTQNKTPKASIHFRRGDYAGSPTVQFVDGYPGTVLNLAGWQALAGVDRDNP